MRKLMLLAAILAVALVAAAPALAQDEPAVVADATKAPMAQAGGAEAKVDCPDGIIESKAGGVVAKAPCEPKPAPPPPPKAAPPPPPAPKAAAPAPAPAPAPAKAELPKTGGSSAASLFALGAGALLVGGGLLARRIIK